VTRDVLSPFCLTHLAADGINPFATVHDWVGQFLVAQKKAPGVNQLGVQWLGEHVQCGHHTIDLCHFRAFLQDRMQSMWSRINQEVLYGIDIGALGIKVELSPRLVDQDVIGNGPFSQSWDILTESEGSIRLQEALACAESSFLTSSPIDFNKAAAWLKSIHMVWQELFCLIHVLGGPFPLFFAEHLELLYSSCSTRRGDFFLADGSLAIVNSYEGNRHSLIGDYKKRFRLLPRQLSIALMVMLQLVRPIELSVVSAIPGTPQDKEKMLWNYRHALYVSHGSRWHVDMLYCIWRDWITRGVGFYLEAQQYRTMCKAWMAKYGTAKNIAWLAKMADSQAGHSESVSQKHYGRLGGIGDLGTAKALLQKEQCSNWHEWLGF
jgi:hypothetical protein